MNRKRTTYDRIAVGERIRDRRISIGLSQDELGEKIDRAAKYCSDIERGICGMSVETMLAIADSLDMSLDFVMFGEASEEELERHKNAETALTHILAQCDPRQFEYAIRMLKLFIASMQSDDKSNEVDQSTSTP